MFGSGEKLMMGDWEKDGRRGRIEGIEDSFSGDSLGLAYFVFCLCLMLNFGALAGDASRHFEQSLSWKQSSPAYTQPGCASSNDEKTKKKAFCYAYDIRKNR